MNGTQLGELNRSPCLLPLANYSHLILLTTDIPIRAFGPQARLVFVNYAREEDFQKLQEMNVTVSGNIVIAKYGKIYRGDKVSCATNSTIC